MLALLPHEANGCAVFYICLRHAYEAAEVSQGKKVCYYEFTNLLGVFTA